MTKKMSNKLIIKIILDITMLVLLLMIYQKSTISMSFHELGGLALGIMFIFHNLLNLNWIKTVTSKLFKKSTSANLKISWVVNFLLLISMVVIIITGIMINKTLPIKIGQFNGAKQWHYFFAALSIALMGIHLGLHWNFIKSLLSKKLHISGKLLKSVGFLLLIITVVFGGYNIGTGSYARWISGPFMSVQGQEMNRPNFENADNGEHPDFSENENVDNYGKSEMKMGMDHSEGNNQGVSITRILSVIFTYGSEIILFATIVVFIMNFTNKNRKQIKYVNSADMC